jgi:hypothetical protein
MQLSCGDALQGVHGPKGYLSSLSGIHFEVVLEEGCLDNRHATI